MKAAAFEGLLEKAASEGKKGAGQYFTPRVLIQSIVRCMKPDPRGQRDFTICDPACGTGGFLVAAYEWLIEQTKGGASTATSPSASGTATYFGQELVARPRRLALMNLYLHGIEPHIALGDSIYEPPTGQRFDVILTNPPFGTKGANQAPDRDDFTVATSNKQLNFLQHVLTILKPGGRAAVVLPDNCLFADQAGEVFKILMRGLRPAHRPAAAARHVHAVQPGHEGQRRLLHQGRRRPRRVWIYDARTNVPGITKKDRPLTPAALRRVREVLRHRPERPGEAQGQRLDGGPLAHASASPRSRSATSSSTASSGSRTSRSTTPTSCRSRRSWPPTRSRSWRRRSAS